MTPVNHHGGLMMKMVKQDKGFTLIELLVVIMLLAVSGKAMYDVYLSQRKMSEVQAQVSAMQMALRAALYYMEDELKMAGCDPSGTTDAGLLQADVSVVQFTADFTGGQNDNIDNDKDGLIDEFIDGLDNDGDGQIDEVDERAEWYDRDTSGPGENITYQLYDSQGDGDLDLGRVSGAQPVQPVAQNIDVLDLVYLNRNGAVLGPLPLGVVQMDSVRAIEITVVARAYQADPDYTNGESYYNRQGTLILGPQNDHYRRMIMSTVVKLRNMGT